MLCCTRRTVQRARQHRQMSCLLQGRGGSEEAGSSSLRSQRVQPPTFRHRDDVTQLHVLDREVDDGGVLLHEEVVLQMRRMEGRVAHTPAISSASEGAAAAGCTHSDLESLMQACQPTLVKRFMCKHMKLGRRVMRKRRRPARMSSVTVEPSNLRMMLKMGTCAEGMEGKAQAARSCQVERRVHCLITA